MNQSEFNITEDLLASKGQQLLHHFIDLIPQYATRTKVVSIDGNEPSTKQLIQRSFSKWIHFDTRSFLGTNRKGRNDSIAKCYVVKADKFNEKKNASIELEQIRLIGEDI